MFQISGFYLKYKIFCQKPAHSYLPKWLCWLLSIFFQMFTVLEMYIFVETTTLKRIQPIVLKDRYVQQWEDPLQFKQMRTWFTSCEFQHNLQMIDWSCLKHCRPGRKFSNLVGTLGTSVCGGHNLVPCHELIYYACGIVKLNW